MIGFGRKITSHEEPSHTYEYLLNEMLIGQVIEDTPQ